MQELELFGTTRNVENLKSVLTSTEILGQVLDSLRLYVRCYQKTGLKKVQVFDIPFNTRIIDFGPKATQIQVRFEADGSTNLKSLVSGEELLVDVNGLIEIDGFRFYLENWEGIDDSVPFILYIDRPEDISQTLQRNIDLSVNARQSSVIELEYNHPSESLGKSVIDVLIYFYIRNEIEQREAKANQTVEFITEQLQDVKVELTRYEEEREKFRRDNNIFNLSEKGVILVNLVQDLERRLSAVDIQIQYYEYVLDGLKNDEQRIISPSSAGLDDPVISGLVLKLNQLANALLQAKLNGSELTPHVSTLQAQLDNTLISLRESVQSSLRNALIKKTQVEKDLEKANQLLLRLPSDERQLASLQRNFKLNENLHNYLLKRISEARIASTSTNSVTKVLNAAYVDKQGQLIKFATLGGIVIVCFLFVCFCVLATDFFRNRIQYVNELNAMDSASPIVVLPDHIGPDISESSPLAIIEGLKKVVSQVENSLKKSRCGIVGIVSFGENENNSFTGNSVALILSKRGYKTMLLRLKGTQGHDTASPQQERNGVKVINLETELFGNPAEHLESLMKDYDYLIVEIPSLHMYSAGLEILPKVDTTIFLTRERVSSRKALTYLENLSKQVTLNNLLRVHFSRGASK